MDYEAISSNALQVLNAQIEHERNLVREFHKWVLDAAADLSEHSADSDLLWEVAAELRRRFPHLFKKPSK